MTKDTLSEILSELGEPGDGGVRIRQGQEVSLHVGRPGEGFQIGPIERVELKKSHVRATGTKGETFLFSYEDLSLVVASTKEKRAGFGST